MAHKTTTAPEWTDLDLTGSNLDRSILNAYTFGGLLLEVAHNVRTITPNAIREQFDRTLRDKMESAREVFRLNAESIYLHAIADRDTDSEQRDDMGEPFTGTLRRLPTGGGGALLLGPAGYLKHKRDQHEQGRTVTAWSDLTVYEQ